MYFVSLIYIVETSLLLPVQSIRMLHSYFLLWLLELFFAITFLYKLCVLHC